ncbi:aminotransferase-like domain-containing protein [Streptacidiphilus fuscans]|uniref:PLP-dependent aminotransferase family protein n=1 Tax=Streptacidiphilus fuscans TaxID=2789292 RepID=A0A931B0S3_9ACTN|nr:PLP-dependent aminotransferase family protein [Streptacidiphilus fuscans]MBF9068969.1 PLP-dependent aminotransferase family protein [Streptacidiphilus fuscans]MBF9073423.1 PLP-dependent aminotransferase family protein [Streptacidiphilus fuscans]
MTDGGAGDDYRLIADEFAAAIADGRLRAGDRLPPQRIFAKRRGVAASTAGRVYAELVRRGLVVGEVGRGTFVRAAPAVPGAGLPLGEPSRARIDLELNYPVVPGQSVLLAEGLTPLLRADALDAALRPARAAGTPAAREAFATLLGTGARWRPDPESLLFAVGGRQAISAVLSALVAPGQRLGVEAQTYPLVRAIAQRLGIVLVPLAMDEHGILPEALSATHRSSPLRAVYLQPRVQNPLGVTMPEQRRACLAGELDRLDLYAVEDGIWSFLEPDVPPLAVLAPERVVLVDSLSKRLAPGLSTGFAVVPDALRPSVATALRSGGWMPSGFALDAAVRWIGDGTLARIADLKRADATARQLLAREHLAGQTLRAHPSSYFCWWELPSLWRAETFVAAAAREGIGITPAAAYVAGDRAAPAAVRIGLASPELPVLAQALDTLLRIARSTPEEYAD